MAPGLLWRNAARTIRASTACPRIVGSGKYRLVKLDVSW
jgi:hypothetical protein